MEYITFNNSEVATDYATADIVEELPEIGDTYHGRTIKEIIPFPFADEQDNPEVYKYAVWKLRLSGDVYWYIAIHEEQGETM